MSVWPIWYSMIRSGWVRCWKKLTSPPAAVECEPDRQRMLLLAYYGAFSREQLSRKLDIPVSLLKASLRRSLAEVEQCLKS